MGDSDSGDTTSEATRLVVEEQSVDPPKRQLSLTTDPLQWNRTRYKDLLRLHVLQETCG